jgi:hypothetical protein
MGDSNGRPQQGGNGGFGRTGNFRIAHFRVSHLSSEAHPVLLAALKFRFAKRRFATTLLRT